MNSMQSQLKAIRKFVRKTPRVVVVPATPVPMHVTARNVSNMDVVSYTVKLPL